ncbi:MAG: 4-carboxymuconolactone decarboxylase / 3-oxoadipate enol-lactonase [Nocardioides sp.]|nr:4-carboxymuconolactone decarboxylase / 3-oxoadipate enol-lactonase [Nocardioides sp.]
MIPHITAVRLSGGARRAELPLLVLGPALGTTASTLWTACAAGLTDLFDVLAWDLPGHGHNKGVPDEAFTMAELAAGVLAVVDDVLEQRDQPRGAFGYAGVSMGGLVGLQLLLDAPSRVTSAVLLCTGAKVGEHQPWLDRIEQVRASGTPVLVAGPAQRWFAPGFLDREPGVGSALLHALEQSADEGYLQACAAIADFDVRDRLGEITAPVLAVAGAEDTVTPPSDLGLIAEGVRDGRLVELAGVAHLAPAEAPEAVARLIREHLLGRIEDAGDDRTVREVRDAGMAVRREVLGAEHVDRAASNASDFTADFEDLITQYAWGGVWTRPGLDRRSRSLITLTALVARGHHEEFALHVRAARSNGLTVQEIKELLLQTAIYCGVPDANAAFRIAQAVLEEMEREDTR